MDAAFVGQKVTYGDGGFVGTVVSVEDDGKHALVQTHNQEERVLVSQLKDPATLI